MNKTLLRISLIALALGFLVFSWKLFNSEGETSLLEPVAKIDAENNTSNPKSDTILKEKSANLIEGSEISTKGKTRSPRDWSDANILDERTSVDEANPSLVYRKRLVTVNDIQEPVIVEELINEGDSILIDSYIANQILVSYSDETSVVEIEKLAKSIGWNKSSESKHPNLILIETDTIDLESAESALTLFNEAQLDDIEYVAEPNRIYYASTTEPNDISYLKEHQWGLAKIEAPKAWDMRTSAADQIIAVIDSGILLDHEDLVNNLWVNPNEIPENGIDDDRNGYRDDVHGINTLHTYKTPNDDNGHGTHVAGIIGASSNNLKGISGVAWKTNLLALKFLNSQGRGDALDAITCIDYAISSNASIINASWGGGYTFALEQAIARAADADIMFVAAAGNEGTDNDAYPTYPASYELPNIIAVGSIDSENDISIFSNTGNRSVDIFAPGNQIFSTFNRSNDDYHSLSGTSMAAPFVSGAAALEGAEFPNADLQSRIQRILLSSRKYKSLNPYCTSGGILDLESLLNLRTIPLPPRFKAVTPSDLNVLQGDSFELEVIVSSDSEYNLKWYFQEELIPNSGSSTLNIQNAQTNQSGIYELRAENNDGTSSITFVVNIAEPSQAIAEALDNSTLEFYNFDTHFWNTLFSAGSEDGDFLSYESTDSKSTFQFAVRLQEPATVRFWIKLEQENNVTNPLSFPDIDTPIYNTPYQKDGWTLIEQDFSNPYPHVLYISVRNPNPDLYDTLAIVSIDNFQTYPIGESPAVIVTQPEKLTVDLGGLAKFHVDAIGEDLNYQWYHNGEPISGEESRTLTISPVLTENEGEYFVRVYNNWGQEDSEKVVLTINVANVAPFFYGDSIEPSEFTVELGDRLSLDFITGGSEPMTYSWKKDGIELSGINSPSLEFYPVKPEHTGVYTLELSNPYSRHTPESRIEVIIESTELMPSFEDSITYQGNGEFSSLLRTPPFTASLPVTYQWFKDGVKIPGANKETLGLGEGTIEEYLEEFGFVGDYYLQITNKFGSALSPIITVELFDSISTALDNREVDYTPFNSVESTGVRDVWLEGGSSLLITPKTLGSYNLWSAYFKVDVNENESMTLWLRTLDPEKVELQTDSELSVSILEEKNGWTRYAISSPSNNVESISVNVVNSSPENLVWVDKIEASIVPRFKSPPLRYTLFNEPNMTLSAELLDEPEGTSYEWFKNETPIAGTNQKILELNSVMAEHGDTFYAIAKTADKEIRTLNTILIIPSTLDSTETRVELSTDSDWKYDAVTKAFESTDTDENYPSVLLTVVGPASLDVDTDDYFEAYANDKLLAFIHGPYSLYIPQGEHQLRLEFSSSYYLDSVSFSSIRISNDFFENIPHFVNYNIGQSDVNGVIPTASVSHTLRWYRGNEFLSEEKKESGDDLYSFPDLGRNWTEDDAGAYRFEVINDDGYTYRSPEIYYSPWVAPSQVLDWSGLSIYSSRSTKYDPIIKTTGNESFYTKGDEVHITTPEFNRDLTYAVWLKSTNAEISISDANRTDELIATSEGWNKIKFQPDLSGTIIIKKESVDEGSSELWIDGYHLNSEFAVAITPRHHGTYDETTAVFNTDTYPATGLSYQWYKDNKQIHGENASTLTITNIDSEDYGDYTVSVSDGEGILRSEPARLFSTSDYGQAIESPYSNISTWGDSPWFIDENTSTNGKRSLRSGLLGESHIRIENNVKGLRSYYLKFESESDSLKMPWTLQTQVDVSGDNSISFSRNESQSSIWIDRLSEQALSYLSFEQWVEANANFEEAEQSSIRTISLYDRNSDPENDNIPNFVEYVLGLDPNDHNQTPHFYFENTEDGTHLRLSLDFEYEGEIQLNLETSSNLIDWSETNLESKGIQIDRSFRNLEFYYDIKEINEDRIFFRYDITPSEPANSSTDILSSHNDLLQ